MNRIVTKICQKMANGIIARLEKFLEEGRTQEFEFLLEMGFRLNDWCLERGIELE